MALLALALAFLPAAAAIVGIGGVDYEAINNATGTPGGDRFERDIGHDHAIQVLQSASSFIWATFHQPPNDRKPVSQIFLTIDDYDGVAATSDDVIEFSAAYIAGFTGDVTTEFDGVLYHELTHVWQWNGAGAAPGGLIEGIADFVRLRAGLGPAHWIQPGEGDRWDQGYDVTARFLDYCDGVGGGNFVAELNRRMETGYTDGWFLELLGKPVEQLWADYKAKYGH